MKRRTLLRKLDLWLGGKPGLFPLYRAQVRLRDAVSGRERHRYLCERSTELVIEGFPRSANTFALVAFEQAQPRPVRVAHHSHVPVQLLRAARFGIPALLLVRPPADAVTSLLVMDGDLGPRDALRYYLQFHDRIGPALDHCLTATFDAVIARYDLVLAALNARFGTAFAVFDPTPANRRRCLARIEELAALRYMRKRHGDAERHAARPSAEREQHKQRHLARLRDEHAGLLRRAQAVYERLAHLDASGYRRDLSQ
jgi:hypothetical protein